MRTLLEVQDFYSVCKSLARGYSHTTDASVTDEDIEVAYSAVCSISSLYCPLYLIPEAKALRDKEKR